MMMESSPNVNVGGKDKTVETSADINTDKSTVINFFGGPGVGKSTAATALFTLLKMHNNNCELVTEFAKDLVWEEGFKILENQLYVFAEQQHRLWRVADKVDFTIVDSPLLLSSIYGEHYNRYCANESFYNYILAEFNRYNNINFFIERSCSYKECGRNESRQEALVVDEKIKDYLHKHNIEYISINSDIVGINTTVDIILKLAEVDKKYEITGV